MAATAFTPFKAEDLPRLREYYAGCSYRLCEYSFGVKWMWRTYLHPCWAEAAGCLVIRNTIEGVVQFDYPIPGEDGDEEAALRFLEEYCSETDIRPILSVVPEEKASRLLLRYPRIQVINERAWKDYLYRSEALSGFSGRRYSGQRNHIRRFQREHPGAEFVSLSGKDTPLLEQFWQAYTEQFRKDSPMARMELAASRELFALLEQGAFFAGGLLWEGRLLAVSLGERCGETLIIHIEKALYDHAGAYPAMVQSFAAHYAGDCRWINREDDARDKGMRTSKLQYLPAELGSKLYFAVGLELDALTEVPRLQTDRLTLDALRDGDREAYNRLCLDDERNRWWGYDYRQDLHGELTETYFLQVVREDFAAHRCVNFAIRREGRCIGEAVLYHPDWRGGMELGCRILPEEAGHGYGTEAFAAVADWALYRLGLARVVAKCYPKNRASYRMLSSCMRPAGEDENFVYFEKLV